MAEEKFYAKALSGFAFCLCFIIYGVTIFIKSEQIDYYTCIYLFTHVVPYSIVVAVCGYFVGKIVDRANSRPRKRKKH